MDDDGALDDPMDWPLKCEQLLDAELRCAICRDLFELPVLLTNCGHTFCDRCINYSISRNNGSAECPSCRIPADRASLCSNIGLMRAVIQFRCARSGLLAASKAARSAAQNVTINSSEQRYDKITSPTIRNTKNAALISTCSASNAIQNPPSLRTNNSDDSNNKCPMCENFIDIQSYAKHVTACVDNHEKNGNNDERKLSNQKNITTTMQSNSKSQEVATQSLPAMMARPFYNGLKYPAVKKLCISVGLSIIGTKDDLVKRHTELVTIFNGQIKAGIIPDLKKIVKEITECENNRILAAREPRATTGVRTMISYKNKEEKEKHLKSVRNHDAQYMSKQGSNFSELILHARKSAHNLKMKNEMETLNTRTTCESADASEKERECIDSLYAKEPKLSTMYETTSKTETNGSDNQGECSDNLCMKRSNLAASRELADASDKDRECSDNFYDKRPKLAIMRGKTSRTQTNGPDIEAECSDSLSSKRPLNEVYYEDPAFILCCSSKRTAPSKEDTSSLIVVSDSDSDDFFKY